MKITTGSASALAGSLGLDVNEDWFQWLGPIWLSCCISQQGLMKNASAE
jgi:hypothetical protein